MDPLGVVNAECNWRGRARIQPWAWGFGMTSAGGLPLARAIEIMVGGIAQVAAVVDP
ncbi:hypothetical protein AB0M45_19470 [Nocardia sp. NPDC051787]|uniref:hypothetical protein n=1 Tax=Nocardia sp. NPDC051787 TaxID=3155415 RepID=UPI0034270C77